MQRRARQLIDEPQLQGSLDVKTERSGEDGQPEQAEAAVYERAGVWPQPFGPPFPGFVGMTRLVGATGRSPSNHIDAMVDPRDIASSNFFARA